MQKKLLAVAVAGVLAAPAAALAQSSVTISGFFKVTADNLKITDTTAARAGLNASENRVSDNSSRILFNVVEDLGSGMQAIAQLDTRFQPDAANVNQTTNVQATGNTFVGLRGASWGTISLGRFDLHYGKQPDDISAKAGALMVSSNAIMSFAGSGATAIALASRTPNVVRYDTPNWGGFTLTAAYSTNPGGVESDLATGAKKGNAWTLNPQFASGGFGLGWSIWRSQNDAGIQTGIVASSGLTPPAAPTTRVEQEGNILYGWYTAPIGLKVGLAIDRSSIDTTTLATGTKVNSSKRMAFNIPLSWTTGRHTLYFSYSKARDDTATVADDAARLIAWAYNYDLSKRTAVAISYARLSNEPGAVYNLYTNATNGAFGSSNSAPNPGEDLILWAIGLKHAF
jgi:predicted porin